MWSVDRLEAYATSYYPDGVPLHTLRYALGRNRVPLHQYARTLVKFATVLLALGHVRTPASILLELFLFRAITPLTQAEVSFFPVFFVGMCNHKKRGRGGGEILGDFGPLAFCVYGLGLLSVYSRNFFF
jgi:hypothetical protein